MGEIFITGKDAVKFINYLLSNDIRKISDNECQYSIMLNDKGGVVDDLLISKYNDENSF